MLPPPAPPPAAGADVDAASAAAAFESESALVRAAARAGVLRVHRTRRRGRAKRTEVEPLSSSLKTDAAVCTSPRTSIVVSRLPRYAIPPGGAHVVALDRTDDVGRGEAVGRQPRGIDGDSSAGRHGAVRADLEMPSTCSSRRHDLVRHDTESAARFSERDVTASVTTVNCAGSKVRTVGAGRSCGSADLAVWMRSCTSVRSVV